MKLVSFEHFVDDIINFVKVSYNYELAMKLIIEYKKLLDSRIEPYMFADYNEENNPLFNTNYNSDWFFVSDLVYILDFNPKSDYCGIHLQSLNREEND